MVYRFTVTDEARATMTAQVDPRDRTLIQAPDTGAAWRSFCGYDLDEWGLPREQDWDCHPITEDELLRLGEYDVSDTVGYDDARVIFDNGGGATLQLGNWAHCYDDMRALANNLVAYRDDSSTEGWDGHDVRARELDPDGEQIRNGGYRLYQLPADRDDLDRLSDSGWGNARALLDALDALGYWNSPVS